MGIPRQSRYRLDSPDLVHYTFPVGWVYQVIMPKTSQKTPIKSLIGMEPILKIIEAALYSAFCKNTQRVSVCLVAPPEAGKTQAMLYFEKFPGVKVFADLTAKPLEDLRPAIQSNEITHLVITDLVAVSAHNKKTSGLLYSRLSAFMEEGMRTTADGGGIKEWASRDGEAPTLGLIAGLTTAMLKDTRSFWTKTGFISRFVPICYEHSASTQATIRETMLTFQRPTIPTKKDVPKEKVSVVIKPEHGEEIIRLAQTYALLNRVYGYRFTSHLSGLIRGRALSQGRRETIDEDVQFLWYVNQYSNPRNPPHI